MPRDIETHLREKIRHSRWMLKMAQEELSRKTGLDVSDIQQLESGEKPISIGCLWEISRALNVPIAFFFEGLDGQDADASELRGAVVLEEEAMRLVRIYSDLPPAQRKGILDLAQLLRDATG